MGNIFFVDESPEEFIRAMGGRIRHAHIKDFLRDDESTEAGKYRSRSGSYLSDAEIGTGNVDLAEVKQAFADVSHDCMFALEFTRVSDEYRVERVVDRLIG